MRVVIKMKIRNLEGKVVDILAYNQVQTDRGVLTMHKWFAQENIEKLDKLRYCRIEKVTAKAILIMNEQEMLWIPKSVIEKLGGD